VGGRHYGERYPKNVALFQERGLCCHTQKEQIMNAMKNASIITGVILLASAIFALIWLWGTAISWATFVKVTITAGVIVIAVLGLALLYREYVEEKDMKKEGYLD
jgi:membrane protein YdbS with pleckstrin-like domain